MGIPGHIPPSWRTCLLCDKVSVSFFWTLYLYYSCIHSFRSTSLRHPKCGHMLGAGGSDAKDRNQLGRGVA